MKKLFKLFKILVVTLIISVLVGAGALYVFFPPSKIKTMAQDYVRNNYSRELDYDGFSFALIGVKVKNFRISEVGNFDNGTFAQADNLVLKAELLPLLKKKVEVKKILLNGIKINVVKNQDGTFNFDNFTSENSQEKPQETQAKTNDTSNLSVKIDNISLENSSFYYTDKQSAMDFKVENVNLTINDFSLNELFSFALKLQTSLDMGTAKIAPLDINLEGKMNLADFNMKNAYIDIAPLALSYRTAKISFSGKVQDFTNPVVNLNGRIEGVNNKIITSITPMDLPDFTLPPADLTVKAETNLDEGKANIRQADLNLGKSYIKNSGEIDFSSQELAYNINAVFNLFLNEIYESAKEMLKEIAPKGDIGGNLNIFTQKGALDLKGKVMLTKAGAILGGKELKDFTGEITVSSLKNIKTNVMSGTYNNSSFKTSLAYSQPSKPVNIDFMLDLDKFTLDDMNFEEMLKSNKEENKDGTEAAEQPSQKEEQKPEEQKKGEKADFGTYNIKLDVKVKEVANNVLTAKDLALKADIKNFSNDYKTLQGVLNISSSEGEIRDINKLASSSKLATAAFAAVKVIYQVFSAAKLDNISLGTGNVIKYSTIDGAYTIKDGVVNLDKSTIVTNLLTVKASGTIDLVTEQLNMKVDTHFGKVEEGSAFKPVALKIKGTMSEPKYSVDVVSTVTSVLSIPKNLLKTGVKTSTNTASGVASGIKDVASAIGNLF